MLRGSTLTWSEEDNTLTKTFDSPLVFSLAQWWTRTLNNLVLPYELPQTRDERIDADVARYEAMKGTGAVLPLLERKDAMLVYPYAIQTQDFYYLSAREREAIEHEGFSKLAKIHHHGSVHGNARLGNLFKSNERWQWIDLGTKINADCDDSLLIANDYLTFTISMGRSFSYDVPKQDHFYTYVFRGTMRRVIPESSYRSIQHLIDMHLDSPVRSMLARRVSRLHLEALHKGLNR